MANYPKELTDLVEEYLTDGIISAKERQVLLKKANALGVDTDEFDLYIDAQQQKVDQVIDAAAAKKRGKTCPFCGGTLPLLTDKCPHCGEIVTPEASEEIQEIFDHLEEALVDFKSGKDIAKSKAVVERYVRKAKMYYENNPKIQRLLEDVQAESYKAEATLQKNARNKTIVSILTYNKKLTTGVIVGILVVLALGIWSLCQGPDLDNPKVVTELINGAIEKGDFQKAETYIIAYDKNHNTDDIVSSILSLAKAYADNDELDKAYSLKSYFSLDGEDVFTTTISEQMVIKGEYDKALSLVKDYFGADVEYIECLNNCVEQMVSCNETASKIKNFILSKVEIVDWGFVPVSEEAVAEQNEKREKLKKRLFDVAEIKYEDTEK